MPALAAPLPIIRPITDLRTQLNDVCTQATATQEPVVLTKNGTASYVLNDSAAYETAGRRNRVDLDLREAEIEARYRPEAVLDLAWRPRAHLDRESIAIYLGVECGNPPAALAAVQRIDAAVERARALPDAGGRFRMEGLDAKEYRTVHANPYTVYYRFDDTTLTVYRVLHQRQSIDTYALVDLPG